MAYLNWSSRAAVAAAMCLMAATVGSQTVGSSARNLILQTSAAVPVQQSQRIALVIGNAAYREAPLANAVNDAKAMGAALKQAGFTVLLHTDVDHRGLLAAVRDFGNRLRQGGVGVFYFAGHGMQIKGRNYLIPVAVDIQREDEVAYAALDAQAVLDKMEAAGNGANLMILDACRNNPFTRSFRSSVQGLAQMEAPVGTLVAFATSPGTVASDGQGQNGLYTQHLLTAMRQPGAKVEEVFKQVRAAVRRDSQGKQIPWEATSLEGDLYFVEPQSLAAPQATATAAADKTPDETIEELYWQAVHKSNEVAVLRGYLTRFPKGQHAEEAWQRVSQLATPEASAATSPPRPAPTAPAVAIAAPPRPATQASTQGAPQHVPPQPDANEHTTTAAVRVEAQHGARPEPPAAVAMTTPTAPTGSKPGAGAGERQPDSAAGRLQQSLLTQADRTPTAVRPTPIVRGGIQVGDRWSYQTTEGGRRTSDVTLQVAMVDAEGVPVFTPLSADGDVISIFARKLLLPAAFSVPPMADRAVWWGDMKSGERRAVTLEVVGRKPDGSVSRIERAVRVLRGADERIRVPAGEFQAWRLDADGRRPSVTSWPDSPSLRWQLRVWYVPELRGFAAIEVEAEELPVTGVVRFNRITRRELGSYQLADSPITAAR